MPSAIARQLLLRHIHSLTVPEVRRLPRIELSPISDRRRYFPDVRFRPVTVSGVPHHGLKVGDPRFSKGWVASREKRGPFSFHSLDYYNPRRHYVGTRSRRGLLRHAVTDYYLSDRVAFERPRSISICRRRSVRRQVIFATGHAAGGARQPRRRRNEYSDISCR